MQDQPDKRWCFTFRRLSLALAMLLAGGLTACSGSKVTVGDQEGGTTRPAISLKGATQPAEDEYVLKDWSDRSTLVGTMALIHLSAVGHVPVYLDECTYADTDAGRTFLAARARGRIAGQRLQSAARTRFKDPPESIIPRFPTPAYAIQQLQAVDSFFADLRHIQQRIDGDNAIVFDDRQPQLVFHARKDAGGWRFKLEEVSGGMEVNGASPFRDAKATIEASDLVVASSNRLVQRIEAGEFQTPLELERAIEADRVELTSQMQPLLKKL